MCMAPVIAFVLCHMDSMAYYDPDALCSMRHALRYRLDQKSHLLVAFASRSDVAIRAFGEVWLIARRSRLVNATQFA